MKVRELTQQVPGHAVVSAAADNESTGFSSQIVVGVDHFTYEISFAGNITVMCAMNYWSKSVSES